MCDASGAPEQARQRPERRKENRVPLDAPVTVRVLAFPPQTLEGRIANISRRGMKLRLSSPLPPGINVQLRMAAKIIMAEVRYAVPNGN
ncbi:MAG TPA: PilZ domain-containing protein, partial [Bryobacteraceae bacterium]|nr:PilZ domain-containing protein [Bryobacteraceae bacterium]